jgi:hypothetical protein
MRWIIGISLLFLLVQCNDPLDLSRDDPHIIPLVEEKWQQVLDQKMLDCFEDAAKKANLIADSLMKMQAIKGYLDSLELPPVPIKPNRPDFIKIDSILVEPIIEGDSIN